MTKTAKTKTAPAPEAAPKSKKGKPEAETTVKATGGKAVATPKEKAAPVAAPKAAEHVSPLKKAKPYPSSNATVVCLLGKREIPMFACEAIALSVLQAAGEGVPLGKKDLMRVIGRHFSGAPGVNTKEGISSGAGGNYNRSVERLQQIGLCRRISAREAGIEGGLGKVGILTKEGAAVKVPDTCKIG